jgi:hypothetical protein
MMNERSARGGGVGGRVNERTRERAQESERAREREREGERESSVQHTARPVRFLVLSPIWRVDPKSPNNRPLLRNFCRSARMASVVCVCKRET